MAKYLVNYTHVKHVECQAFIEADSDLEARQKLHQGDVLEEIEVKEDWWEIRPNGSKIKTDKEFEQWKKDNHHLLVDLDTE